jgi:hypothetical protein
VDGLIDDELDADRGGQMEDEVALFNQQVHRAGISHGVADELKVRVVLNGCDVVDGAGAAPVINTCIDKLRDCIVFSC